MNTQGLHALHDRYLTQARWTEALRRLCLDRIKLPIRPQVLEVGSGTGCITAWIAQEVGHPVYGIDIDLPTVQFAARNDPKNGYAHGDGCALPLPTDTFHLTFCHFLLLWTTKPGQILSEMKRCTRPSGWVIAFAEPDYGGRIDYPDPLSILGDYQSSALEESGAFPQIGRQIRGLFAAAGLQQVQAGLLGGEWGPAPPDDLRSEWTVLKADLADSLPASQINALEDLDRQAWQSQERILFVPTFFALGQKPHESNV
jgi:SAM-dependent methyltransferase